MNGHDKIQHATDEEKRAYQEHLDALGRFQLIHDNIYPLSRLRPINYEEDDIAVCFCKKDNVNPSSDEKICTDVSCLNFATYIECTKGYCPAEPHCGNQRLQLKQFPNIQAFKTQHKGFGLKSMEKISKGQIIREYVGEVIDEEELDGRLRNAKKSEENFYYLMLRPNVYIDARYKGSLARFFNHSCEPNCKTEKWSVKGETKIAIIAIDEIKKGQELSFDYQWKSLGRRHMKCFCGAPSCKGSLSIVEDEVEHNEEINGFFRDPNGNEIGKELVGHRIRYYHKEGHVYLTVIIKDYHSKSNRYQVIYEASDDNSNNNNNNSITYPTEIDLTKLKWHIYIDFEGKSQDEIQKEIFLIPKRKGSLSSIHDSNDNLKQLSISLNDSSSSMIGIDGTIGSTYSPHTILKQNDQKKNLSWILQQKNMLNTTKAIIKNIPSHVTMDMLLNLLNRLNFTIEKNLNHPGIEMKSFPDGKSWALIYLQSNEQVLKLKKIMDGRPFSGNNLRIFPAFEKDVVKFQRINSFNLTRQTLIHEQDTSSYETNNHENNDNRIIKEQEENEKMEEIDQEDGKKFSNRFGMRICWQITLKELENSPCRAQGISRRAEDQFRKRAWKMLMKTIEQENLPLDVHEASQAMLMIHRFLTIQSIDINTIEVLSAVSLHVITKCKGIKIAFKDLLVATYAARFDSSSNLKKLKTNSDEYLFWERKVLALENTFLEGIRYDLCVEDPLNILKQMTQLKEDNDEEKNSIKEGFSNTVIKDCKKFMMDCLQDPIWVCYPTDYIILSCLCIVHAIYLYKKKNSLNSMIWNPKIPSWLPTFTNQFPVQKQMMKDTIQMLLQVSFIRNNQLIFKFENVVDISKEIENVCMNWIDSFDDDNDDKDNDDDDVKEENNNIQDEDKENEINQRRNYFSSTLIPCSSTSSLFPKHLSSLDELKLNCFCFEGFYHQGKRNYFGKLNDNLPCSLASHVVYLQQFPFRISSTQSLSSKNHLNGSALRELASIVKIQAIAPWAILNCYGIVFPPSKKQLALTESYDVEEKVKKAKLDNDKHYLIFDRPQHNLAGLLQSSDLDLSISLKRFLLKDILRSVSICHESGLIHRCLTSSNIYMIKNRWVLSGFFFSRQVISQRVHKAKYKLNDKERMEHSHGFMLPITAPEILLGDEIYTPACDIWSIGCLIVFLFSKKILFGGLDTKTQIEYIYRICGCPNIKQDKRLTKLSKFKEYQPSKEYRNRLIKTLNEYKLDNEVLVDLIQQCLQLNPSNRKTARELLQHEYFQQETEQEYQQVQQEQNELLQKDPMISEDSFSNKLSSSHDKKKRKSYTSTQKESMVSNAMINFNSSSTSFSSFTSFHSNTQSFPFGTRIGTSNETSALSGTPLGTGLPPISENPIQFESMIGLQEEITKEKIDETQHKKRKYKK